MIKLTTQAAEQAAGGGEAVGEATYMPGTTGFTMCVFEAAKVPEGTRVYTHPAPAAPVPDPNNPGWCIGCNPDNCVGCGNGLPAPVQPVGVRQ